MVILEFLLLLSMAFNPGLEFNHFTWFTLVSRILFPLIVLLFGYKGMWIFFFVTSSVNTLDITFNDFTALSAFCVLYLFIPKKYNFIKPLCFITYTILVFIVAILHNKQPYHLFAHFIGCCILLLSVHKLKYGKISIPRINKLDLTNDEILILEEMCEGRLQKEISKFSQNTVTNKLKQARERNNIKTTDELISIYKKSIIN